MANETSLSWDAHAQARDWSPQLLASVANRKAQLDQGEPDTFVSGYSGLSPALQVKFWAELIVAVARFESNCNPKAIFREPPPLGVNSVGLLRLSYEDQIPYGLEPLDRRKASLEDPFVNLRCGVKIFATLVAKDGVVASSVDKKHRGAARYWSVLRTGHHIEEIKMITQVHVGL